MTRSQTRTAERLTRENESYAEHLLQVIEAFKQLKGYSKWISSPSGREFYMTNGKDGTKDMKLFAKRCKNAVEMLNRDN